MQQTCAHCSTQFTIDPLDLDFYDRVSPTFAGKKYAIPAPKLCFHCRLQRRMSFYNCRSVYKRTCDATKKPIVSIFSPDKPFTVYDKNVWFGDSWDPKSFGVDVDFTRPFLPQVRELAVRTPMLCIMHFGEENPNSDYTNDNYKIKNCYLVFDGEQAEDCMYGQTYVMSRSCVDFLFIHRCELCYGCCYCDESYNLRYCRFCKNCSDSWFLRDCIGCRNCFGCANLRQKQYCIWNQQKTKQEYDEFMNVFRSDSHAAVLAMRQKAEEFFKNQPVRATRGEQNQNSFGDNLNNSKNAYYCFDCFAQEDCRYCTNCLMSAKDTMDMHVWGDGLEVSYDCCVTGANSRNLLFCYNVSQGCSDILYSLYCSQSSKNLFGCVGLRHAQYCILNKQYSKEEYEQLAARVVEHMIKNGEWGEFFASKYALFGYNETVAQTYFPLTKEEAHKRGWQWCDYEAAVEAKRSIPAQKLPDSTADIPDDVLDWALVCELTGKPFKLTKQELEFYRTHKLPLPRLHPNERHRQRTLLRNPFRLWARMCGVCGKEIQTSYAPERPERVLCEACYLKEVY